MVVIKREITQISLIIQIKKGDSINQLNCRIITNTKIIIISYKLLECIKMSRNNKVLRI